jgi:hypothetical protein
MATQHLRCGCVCVGGNAWSYTLCREGHSPENPPDGGRVGAVPPTPAAARRKKAASSEGQSGKAGRWVMPKTGGMVEPWKKDGGDG